MTANSVGSLGGLPSRTSPPTAVGDPANTKDSSGAGSPSGTQTGEHEGGHLHPVQGGQRPQLLEAGRALALLDGHVEVGAGVGGGEAVGRRRGAGGAADEGQHQPAGQRDRDGQQC